MINNGSIIATLICIFTVSTAANAIDISGTGTSPYKNLPTQYKVTNSGTTYVDPITKVNASGHPSQVLTNRNATVTGINQSTGANYNAKVLGNKVQYADSNGVVVNTQIPSNVATGLNGIQYGVNGVGYATGVPSQASINAIVGNAMAGSGAGVASGVGIGVPAAMGGVAQVPSAVGAGMGGIGAAGYGLDEAAKAWGVK